MRTEILFFLLAVFFFVLCALAIMLAVRKKRIWLGVIAAILLLVALFCAWVSYSTHCIPLNGTHPAMPGEVVPLSLSLSSGFVFE